MGISQDKFHKRRKTGGRRKPIRGKRKFELGRPPSNTKLGGDKVTRIRVRGGNYKMRALRLDHANYGWASEGIARKTRILDVVYNPSSNELVRTKSLTKSTIVQIDAAPFRQWYESHYALPIGRKPKKIVAEKPKGKEEGVETKEGGKGKVKAKSAPKQTKNEDLPPYERVRSKSTTKKYVQRQKNAFVDPAVADQFLTGKLLAQISARPGQVGRADGYILEGNELQFYMKKIKMKKGRAVGEKKAE